MADQSGEKGNPVKEVFEELFSLLENLETQNVAVMAFLKDQGIATDEKLAPYLDQAGNAANVRWRAARVRMDHLFSPIPTAVLDREPAKAAPKENESPEKWTEAKEKSETTEAKKYEEKSAPPKAGNTDKNASTKDQSANQQPAEPKNADQPKTADQPQPSGQAEVKDTKGSKSTDPENKKTASATASAGSSTAPPPRGPVGPGAVAQEKGGAKEEAKNNQPDK